MTKNRLSHILLCLLVLVAGTARADEEEDLIATLQSDAGIPQKCSACFRLRIVGTAKSVPALAALLDEERLSHAARNALEAMPCPQAGAALRQALAGSAGASRLGIISALGNRRDEKAAGAIGDLLASRQRDVATESARALGRIGAESSIRRLEWALTGPCQADSDVVADAYLEFADHYLAAGKRDWALKMYDRVLDPALPGHIRAAALQGYVACASPEAAVAQVIAGLKSEDRQLRIGAARAAREVQGAQATAAMVSILNDLPDAPRILLIHALAERGDRAALPAVRENMGSMNPAVRTAVVGAIAALGDRRHAAMLARHASIATSDQEREWTRYNIARMRADGIDATLIEDLESPLVKARPKWQVEIITVLAQRQATEAIPALIRTARSAERLVRSASVDALRQLAGPEHLAALIDLLAEAESGEQGRVRRALVAVANRCKAEGPASQELLRKQRAVDDVGVRSAMLLALGDLGQDSALPVLRAALCDDHDDLRRAAIVALSRWPNAQPKADLLQVAQESDNKTHQVLALRGYIDLVASADVTSDERVQCYRTAMALATGTAEKRKVLAALPEVRTLDALRLAESSLADAQVRQEAALAVATIAQDIYAKNAGPVKAALEHVVTAGVGEDIKAQAQKTLDEIEAVRSYLLDWEVAGPYVRKDKNCTQLFDIAFDPERKDTQVQWRKMPVSVQGEHAGYLDLLKELDGGEQRVAYLRTQFESPEERSTVLEIFSDDGVKVWLNGKVVHANNTMRPIMPEPDRVNVTLRKGANHLMLKVTQNNLPWGAIVRTKDVKAPEPVLGPGFKLHTINAESRFEAAGILDANRDGKLDIFCGGFWYEAPTWKKHFVREVKEEGDYHYDFANLPMDVDGDGWTDIANAAWHNKLLFWVRNPGQAGGPWEVIEIDTPGNMETAVTEDVNGDGQPDVLPNIMSQAAWYEFHRDASAPHGVRWEKHQLPQQAAGHGLGSGDVNGDGRCDIVTPKGWLEQLADGWQWHPEFELGHASIPILVHDVDEDGDADIIWGLGHNYGLSWLEQSKQGDQRSWQKHLIDDSWSQPHFLILADLDGDGRDELITGKRYHAHNGHDPGGNDPVCVYYYDFDTAAGKWTRHTMHEGGRVGFGINTGVADMDGDGDIDVVAPGKSGLYLFENLGR